MTNSTPLSAPVEKMYARLETYLNSDLSPKTFCQQLQLTFSTLQYWRRTYIAHKRQDDAPTIPHPWFLPLRARQVAAVPSLAQWVIESPHGVIVRMSRTIEVHLPSQRNHSAGQ